jgi:hypothetical protein
LGCVGEREDGNLSVAINNGARDIVEVRNRIRNRIGLNEGENVIPNNYPKKDAHAEENLFYNEGNSILKYEVSNPICKDCEDYTSQFKATTTTPYSGKKSNKRSKSEKNKNSDWDPLNLFGGD